MNHISVGLSPASWLARLDPMLAMLSEALPPAVADSSLHDASWVPGELCRLVYRVPRPDGTDTLVAVQVTPEGWRRYDYRDDAELPGLARAGDPARAAVMLAPLYHHDVRVCRVQPVRYRPGSRCVLRYDVDTGSGSSTLYAKVLHPERFEEISWLGTSLGLLPARDLVSPVVAVWPQMQTMVVREVPGRTVAQALGDTGSPSGERDHLAYELGIALARFHAQPDVALARWTTDDQVHRLVRSLPAVRLVDAEVGERLRRAVDTLRLEAPAPEHEVLCHGSLRPGQVMVTPDGALVLLDTDGVCSSVPERDLGIVLAHLTWQAMRQPENRSALATAERAVLSGYQCHAGPVDPRSLRWWRAAGLVQVAVRRYRRLEGTAWPLVHLLADATDQACDGLRVRRSPQGPTNPLDTQQMSAVLREQLPLVSDVCPEPLRVTSAVGLPSSPGRRAVVRYNVGGADGGGTFAMVGKTFTEPRRARLLYDHLCLLHFGPFHSGSLHVPEPVGLLPGHLLVLYRGCEGVPLDRVPPSRLDDGVAGAAHWLARLHTCDVRLPRRFSLADETGTCRRWADTIAQTYPHLAEPAYRVAGAWPAAVLKAGSDAQVPIHKDFHPAHVLVGDEICVVDLDEARLGDPAFDVAHFCAYLALRDEDPAHVEALSEAFVHEYAAETGWTDRGTYDAFFAYTCLKIARQWATGSGPCRGASPEQRLAGTERELAEAERWLAA